MSTTKNKQTKNETKDTGVIGESDELIDREEIWHFPDNIYLFKANNRNTRKRCEICSKLTIKITERHQSRRSGVFIANLNIF